MHQTAEEVLSASRTLPAAIMWSFALNVLLGLTMIITLIFTWGDMTEIASTATGYPFLQIFIDVTNSLGGTNGMTCLIIIPLTASCVAVVATASRQIWAFARDNGVPFSPLIAKVRTPYMGVRKT